MKILITGVCGHIGSAMANHLLGMSAPDYSIIGVDNMSSNRYCSLFDNNLMAKITFIESDFVDIPALVLADVDAVVHLAAVTDAPNSVGSPGEVEKTNVLDTVEFIDKCTLTKVPLFIFPSSTSVYGEAGRVDESSKVNPQSPYAEAKVVIEDYLKKASAVNPDFKHVVLRCGTVFGFSSGVRFHTAIQKFCWQASTGQPLTVWKQNYEQVRPYLGINDACRAISRVLPTPVGWTQAKDIHNQIFNVLTKNLTPKEVIEVISSQLPVEIRLVETPLLNQYSYDVDDTKFRNTGYLAYDSLEYQIKKLLGKLGRTKWE